MKALKSLWPLGLILIALAVPIYQWTWLRYSSLEAQERFELLWQEDLKVLHRQGELPASWQDIQTVTHSPASDSPLWLNEAKVPLTLNPQGNRRLEIDSFFWQLDGKDGITLVYHLIDTSNDNTVWEFGRTLVIGGNSTPPEPKD